MNFFRIVRRNILLAAAVLIPALVWAAPGPVEFDFSVPASAGGTNPFERELWAQVETPGGSTVVLPAFYCGEGLFGVRARPERTGDYRLGPIWETGPNGARTPVAGKASTPTTVSVHEALHLPSVSLDPADPTRFQKSDGNPYVPVGANLAWDPRSVTDPVEYYSRAFPAFAGAGLNWMRVWMAHWDGLDLSWLPHGGGPSPEPGRIDLAVVRRWDGIIGSATQSGVYVQLVLQHHGQYSTSTDSDWAANPWNGANPGGFLSKPEDFFTDPGARKHTFLKFRTVVARLGWSPAILSWELFNEVHWTDAVRKGHEADVARWHSDAAAFVRSVDAYHHLVTTSTDRVPSAINDSMDYLQPHLYAMDMVAAARVFYPSALTLRKPIFYGEEGDDHQVLSAEEKSARTGTVPPIWASIMGEGTYAAEPWEGWDLLDHDRLGEVGAVRRFLEGSGIMKQGHLTPFSGAADCTVKVPLQINACHYWQHRPAPDIEILTDGSSPMDFAEIPYSLVGTDSKPSEGFPDHATYRIHAPTALECRVRVDEAGAPGGSLEVSVDGSVVAGRSWKQGRIGDEEGIVPFHLPAGNHTLLLRSAGRGWIGVPYVDLGDETPDLASIGRRNDVFIAAWVYSRTNLYLPNPSAAVSGILNLGQTPRGSWTVTWWDTHTGLPVESHPLFHPGGVLLIPVPALVRHAAVSLVRAGAP